MKKRAILLFTVLISMAATLFFRLYYLTSGDALSTAAQTQSSYKLDVFKQRGIIYDANFKRITNVTPRYIAAVLPCQQATDALSKVVVGEERLEMLENIQNGRPFLMEVDTPNIYAYGIDVFETSNRYQENQPACHIVGHLQDDQGVYGIEKAFNEVLSTCGGQAQVRYAVDARHTPLAGTVPEIQQNLSKEGVVLTLDLDLQKKAEEIASYYITKGAVIVMNVETGDIKASVSLPSFSPLNIAQSINDENQPFVNRVFSAYNVGSTFKLVTAACALESGISKDLAYECVGAIEIDGVRFGCHKLSGHGWLTMQRAIEQSCNPYFINLGQKLDRKKLLDLSYSFGITRKSILAPGMITASGTLPTVQELESNAVMANFTFGQGSLTATPLQIAQIISTIANGGRTVTPRLVVGATVDGEHLSQENPNLVPVQILNPQTTQVLQRMMISTVEQGSGTNAKPDFGSAGGKTASAQTGIFENGKEIVHAWFSGFYPAQNPKYAIVVLNEGGNSGGAVAAPVFREIANAIAELKL